jgi:hypothetical protein
VSERQGRIALDGHKLRKDSHVPRFLEPRHTTEGAPVSCPRARVSRLCADIVERVGAALGRPMDGAIRIAVTPTFLQLTPAPHSARTDAGASWRAWSGCK